MPSALSGLSVLHVEDNPDDARRIRALLLSEGARVQWAYDPSHARALVRAHPFDVAVVDVVLPGESGLALAQDLRSGEAPLASVLLSSMEDPRVWALTQERAARLGLRWLLRKTEAPAELVASIQDAAGSGVPVAVLADDTDSFGYEVRVARAWAEHPGPLQRRVGALGSEFNLKPQEADAVEGLGLGLNDKEIGELLGVSRPRVGQVLRAAFDKMGVKGRHGFVAMLLRRIE